MGWVNALWKCREEKKPAKNKGFDTRMEIVEEWYIVVVQLGAKISRVKEFPIIACRRVKENLANESGWIIEMSVSFEDKEVWILSGSVTDYHYQLLISFIKRNSLHCS